MSAPICFTDTETLSMRPGRQAWEIAVIKRVPGGRDERVWIVVAEDLDLSQADPQSLEINGFYRRHPDMNGTATYGDSGPQYGSEAWVMQDVEEWTRGALVFGVNPAYDTGTLDPRMRAHRLLPSWNYQVGDLKAMAAGWLLGFATRMYNNSGGNPDVIAEADRIRDIALPPWHTEELAKACGVELPSQDERHTALGDARFGERWYDALTGGVL